MADRDTPRTRRDSDTSRTRRDSDTSRTRRDSDPSRARRDSDTSRTRRDRDTAGRARNARPRDEAGRPLSRDAAGVERVPDDLVLPPAQALAEAERLVASGRPFHAHEVLEGVWKAAPEHERELWRGLAQIAVGLTHAQRGNATGAARLLQRGAERVAAYAEHPPHDVDASRVAAEASHLASLVQHHGLDALDPGRTVLTFRR